MVPCTWQTPKTVACMLQYEMLAKLNLSSLALSGLKKQLVLEKKEQSMTQSDCGITFCVEPLFLVLSQEGRYGELKDSCKFLHNLPSSQTLRNYYLPLSVYYRACPQMFPMETLSLET